MTSVHTSFQKDDFCLNFFNVVASFGHVNVMIFFNEVLIFFMLVITGALQEDLLLLSSQTFYFCLLQIV